MCKADSVSIQTCVPLLNFYCSGQVRIDVCYLLAPSACASLTCFSLYQLLLCLGLSEAHCKQLWA